MISNQKFLGNLKDALVVLSKPANEQIGFVYRMCGGSFDELALQLDDATITIDEKFKLKVLSSNQYYGIKELSALLDSMSGEKNESLWDEKALSKTVEWQQVRELAKNCLESLDY